MKHKIAMAACSLLFLAACIDESTVYVTPESNTESNGPVMVNASSDALPNVVLVKFREEVTEQVENTLQSARSQSAPNRSGISRFDGFLNEVGAVTLKRLFPANKFEERTRRSGLHRWYKVEFDSSISPKEVENRLKDISELSVVQFALPLTVNDDYKTMVLRGNEVLSRTENTGTPITNDTYFPLQWSFLNDGTLMEGAKPGADINVAGAWERCTGDPNVIVAVLDEGVQAKHPDLAANMWINEAELNGEPGVDDDGNGYIDDIYGANFTSDSPDITPGQHGNACSRYHSGCPQQQPGSSRYSRWR